jgi:hypothetical protein
MSKKVDYEKWSREDILNEIVRKKEFSNLPMEDVGLVYSQFEKEDVLVRDRIKMTRDLLRKMYTAFISDRLLSLKDRDADWFLKRHISTKERLECYEEVYYRCLSPVAYQQLPVLVFDFGCGVNGFSYEYMGKLGDVKYIGTEPVGQLCDLQNVWFKKRAMDARVEHISLFDLEKNVDLVRSFEGKKVGFFFKVLDSLEMFKKNYSKEVLVELVPLFDRCVVSWATGSLMSKKKFHAQRKWLRDFVEENFEIIDEFECGVEHYLVFKPGDTPS